MHNSLEEDPPGDISDFQTPLKQDWEYVDENQRYPGVLVLDQASDMLADTGTTIVLADFFLKIGETLATYNETSDLEIQVINSVRELTQSLSKELMEGEDMFMVPSSNSEIISSLKYMFNRVIEALEVYAK